MAPVNTDNNFDTFFRRAFFAGRVQFFSLGKHGNLDGKKRYDICDINSAFPWSMVSPHFFSSEYIQLEKVPKRYKEQCFYEISCESFGALPFREKNGGVSFPHRKGDWFVCGWELFTAKKLKLIKNLKIYAIYQPSIINDFSEYISYFYELKKNAKTQADREIAKSFLNSLYGKFAQNNREARDVIVTLYGDAVPIRLTPIKQNKTLINSVRKQLKKYSQKAEDSEHGKILYTEYGDKCYAFDDENRLCVFEYWQHSYDDESRGLSFWQLPTLTEEENLRFYNVATAASITSKVRAFLAESIHACKTPLYCDTDSIIAADCSPLKKSDELGDWKLELECDAVWIGGKKLYVAHSADDKGQTEKPKGKFFREVHLPQYNFRRWYVTKKDFNKSWKKAHKGARLSIEKMIHVCEGGEATCSFDAPNYSPFSPPKFTRRTVRRDDKRKR